MDKTLRISLEVYSKIFLHSAKYPACPILGYIIGSDEKDEINVSDLLPICHSFPSGPILDLCGETAELLLKPHTKVLGLYFSNDRLVDEKTPVYVERLAAGVKEIVGECIVIQVKNSLLSDRNKLFIEAHSTSVKNRRIKCEMLDSLQVMNEMLDRLLVATQHRAFADFEDHMNGGISNSGATVDFTNASITAFITKS